MVDDEQDLECLLHLLIVGGLPSLRSLLRKPEKNDLPHRRCRRTGREMQRQLLQEVLILLGEVRKCCCCIDALDGHMAMGWPKLVGPALLLNLGVLLPCCNRWRSTTYWARGTQEDDAGELPQQLHSVQGALGDQADHRMVLVLLLLLGLLLLMLASCPTTTTLRACWLLLGKPPGAGCLRSLALLLFLPDPLLCQLCGVQAAPVLVFGLLPHAGQEDKGQEAEEDHAEQCDPEEGRGR